MGLPASSSDAWALLYACAAIYFFVAGMATVELVRWIIRKRKAIKDSQAFQARLCELWEKGQEREHSK